MKRREIIKSTLCLPFIPTLGIPKKKYDINKDWYELLQAPRTLLKSANFHKIEPGSWLMFLTGPAHRLVQSGSKAKITSPDWCDIQEVQQGSYYTKIDEFTVYRTEQMNPVTATLYGKATNGYLLNV